MFGLFDSIADWFKGLLIEGIISNFTGMFNEVNDKVGEIAGQVGQTPQGWNAGIFGMVRTLSETVVIPVAGVILTFILCYELIHMVIEKNNMHECVLYRGGYSPSKKKRGKINSFAATNDGLCQRRSIDLCAVLERLWKSQLRSDAFILPQSS